MLTVPAVPAATASRESSAAVNQVHALTGSLPTGCPSLAERGVDSRMACEKGPPREVRSGSERAVQHGEAVIGE